VRWSRTVKERMNEPLEVKVMETSGNGMNKKRETSEQNEQMV